MKLSCLQKIVKLGALIIRSLQAALTVAAEQQPCCVQVVEWIGYKGTNSNQIRLIVPVSKPKSQITDQVVISFLLPEADHPQISAIKPPIPKHSDKTIVSIPSPFWPLLNISIITNTKQAIHAPPSRTWNNIPMRLEISGIF